MRWIMGRKEKNHGHQSKAVEVHRPPIGGSDNEISSAAEVEGRAGHDRVCHPCRGARGHRRDRNCRFQGKDSRFVERHSKRNQRSIEIPRGRSGQSTVEFAVVTAGFLAATVALGAMWRVFGDGLLVEHALAVASHHVQSVAPVTLVDIFLY